MQLLLVNRFRAGLALAACLFGCPALAADLTVGAVAPEFALQGSDGKIHRLSDYRGKTVVLAWFPKAFTGG
jgi:peroxiredoxin Q/BCP